MPSEDDNLDSAFTTAMANQAVATAETPAPVANETVAASQSVVETPLATTTTPVTPVAPNPLFEMARQAGFQLGENPTEAEVARLALQQVQSLGPMAQYAQQILPHAAEFQKFLESQQKQVVPETPADEWTAEKYFGDQWGANWDSKYSAAIEQGMVVRDPQTGLWAPAPGYEMIVSGMLPQLNEAQQRQSQNWQEITRGNPYQHFYEKLQEPLRRAWQQDMQTAIQEQFQRAQRESAIDRFEQQNSAWLYAQQNGQRTVTPQGQKFLSAVDDLQKAGVSDPEQILRFASQMSGVGAQQTPVAAVPTVANPVAASQQQQQSFLQNAIARSGHSAGAVADPVSPINVEETDLNNMFVSALRQSQGQGA